MRRKIVSLAGSALMLGLAAAPWTPAQAADMQYVSGPGGVVAGWTAPVIVVRAGDTLTYTNADIAPHDLVALDRFGPDDPWCAQAGFAEGQCPIVWTPAITLGQSTQVYGMNNLQPGDQFKFECRLHRNMVGDFIVSPA